jgi:hypothetical protein
MNNLPVTFALVLHLIFLFLFLPLRLRTVASLSPGARLSLMHPRAGARLTRACARLCDRSAYPPHRHGPRPGYFILTYQLLICSLLLGGRLSRPALAGGSRLTRPSAYALARPRLTRGRPEALALA